MGLGIQKQQLKRFGLSIIVIVVTVLATSALLQAQGSQLKDRSLKLSDARASATAVYNFSYRSTALDTIQTVAFEVCSNNAFPGTPCTAPTGLDMTNTSLISQSGDEGFSISASLSTANRVVLTRPPLVSSLETSTYVFDNVKNPSQIGSYFVRILTYPDGSLSSEPTNYGALSFAINSNISVTATVPPYLLFCAGVKVAGNDCENVTGNYIDFGEFNSRQASQASTQMLASTNAKDGYSVRLSGTTLTSGNNIIPALFGADVSRPGTSQFGMNLRANSAPQGGVDPVGTGAGTPVSGYNQINFYKFNDGDVVAVSLAPDYARKYTSTYVVNINKSQAPGVYVSTVTYIALGNF